MTDNTMDMEAQITLMKFYLDNAEKELASLKNGKKVSGARVRVNLMKLKKSSHTMRKNVMELSKSLPTKPRVKKTSVEPEDEELPPPPVLKRETKTLSGEEEPKKKPRAPRKKPVKKETVV